MIETKYLTHNRTYKNPEKINPIYVVVHSTGLGLTSRTTLFNAWNNESVSLSVHGMVDDKGCTLTLPPDIIGWHVGKLGNRYSVGFEIAEPPFIEYKDKNHVFVDVTRYNPKDPFIIEDFKKRWWNAVEMATYLCDKTGVTPQHVLCHAEMYAIERATNHADVLHWFSLFGEEYGMDMFRGAVKKQLDALKKSREPKPAEQTKPAPKPKAKRKPVVTGGTEDAKQ